MALVVSVGVPGAVVAPVAAHAEELPAGDAADAAVGDVEPIVPVGPLPDPLPSDLGSSLTVASFDRLALGPVGASSSVVDMAVTDRPVRAGTSPVSIQFVKVTDEQVRAAQPAPTEQPATTEPAVVPTTPVDSTPPTATTTPDVAVVDSVPSGSVPPPMGEPAATVPPSTDPATTQVPPSSAPAATEPPVTEPPVTKPPVTVPPPAPVVPRLGVEVVDEKVAAAAGLEKLAFQVKSLDGSFKAGTTARFSIDYSSFRDAYGADWAGRLQVMVFDGCWLVDPSDKLCPAPRPLESFATNESYVTNDVAAGVITFQVEFSNLVGALQLAGGTGGGFSFPLSGTTGAPGFGLNGSAVSATGNYAATSLNATSKWSVGLQAGDFNYSYGFPAPPPPAGPAPDVALSYSSQAIDGMTADENTQGGKAGPGWSMGDAFIERRFKTCALDNGSSGDLCWFDKNMTVSMPGVSGELVADGNESVVGAWTIDRYRLSSGVGWKFLHFYRTDMGASRGAFGQDNDREVFEAISPDGVAYWFGYGTNTGTPLTADPGTGLGSVWTVPVIGNGTGEPCHSLSGSWCHQAYRWMLDRVVDAQGRSMNFQYSTEQNYYGALGAPNATQPYVSGGRLEMIRYGQAASAASSSTNTHRLDLNYLPRCQPLSSESSPCATPTSASAASSYPDIPVDVLCSAAQTCTNYSPTFFDLRYLSSVSAETRTTATGFSETMRWVLDFDWVDADLTSNDPVRLWLRSVQRFGTEYTSPQPANDDLDLGLTKFDAPVVGSLPNRVDHGGGLTEMFYYRLGRILDDQGGLIEVVYGQPKACTTTNLEATAGLHPGWNYNTWSCFARWWWPNNSVDCSDTGGTPPPGKVCAGFGIWHKWVVDKVIEHDMTGRSPDVTHDYVYRQTLNDPDVKLKPDGSSYYNGGMAWHADTDRFLPVSERSWAEYRGFYEVREKIGSGSDPVVTKVYRFYRGMNGDKVSHDTGSPTKSVTIVNSLPTSTGDTSKPDDNWLYGQMIESFTAASATAAASQANDPDGVVTIYDSKFSIEVGIDQSRWVEWVVPTSLYARSDGQYSKQAWTYDGVARETQHREWGRVTSTYTNTSDLNGNSDDRCTATTYTTTGVWFPRGLPARSVLRAVGDCATTGTLLSDVSLFYDGNSATSSGVPNNPVSQAAPGAGQLTAKLSYTGATGASGVVDDATARTVVDFIVERTSYENLGTDSPPRWGRPLTTTDARGKVTTYSYVDRGAGSSTYDLSVAASHIVSSSTVTNPAGHVVTTSFDTVENPYRMTDINGRVTQACFDEAGRVRYVYSVRDAKPATSPYYVSSIDDSSANCSATTASARYKYYVDHTLAAPSPAISGDHTYRHALFEEHRVNQTTPTAGRWTGTWTLNDGLGRTYITKTPSPSSTVDANGNPTTERTIAQATRYDTLGRVVAQSQPFASSSGFNQNAFTIVPADIPRDNRTTYDVYGRVSQQQLYNNDALLRKSVTTYNGTATTVTPMYSGTSSPYGPTVTTTDTYGRTIKTVTDSGGVAATTLYQYNGRDQIVETTPPALGSNPSTYTYNYLGWQTAANDNNRGKTTATYFESGQLASTTDAAGETVYYTIDALGRTLNAYQGVGDFATSATTSRLLQAFTYDETGGKGQVDTATSYQPAGVVAFTADAATFDATGYLTSTQVTANAINPGPYNPAGATLIYDDTDSDDMLAPTVSLDATYTVDGLLATQWYPGAANWAVTTNWDVDHTYSNAFGTAGQLVKAAHGTTQYIADQSYDSLGRPDITQLRSGTWGINLDQNFQIEDARPEYTYARLIDSTGTPTATYPSKEILTYDDAGQVTQIARDASIAAGDEKECFYYDTGQRLTTAATVTLGTTTCPATPPGTPAGGAPYSQTFSLDARNNIQTGGGQTRTYATAVTSLTCASGTETAKPDAVSAITAGGGNPAETFRYDCNGSIMSRYQTSTASAYAWDPFNRLEAVSTGTRVTWTNQTNTTSNSFNDLTSAATLNDTAWTAGASSTQTLTGDGAVSFRFAQTPAPRQAIGLNTTDTNTNYTDLDYAILQRDNEIKIFESGTERCKSASPCSWFDHVTDTDIFTIQRVGTTVNYLRNGRVFYRSSVAASGSYKIDTAFIRPSTTIRDVTLATGTTGVERNIYDTTGQRVVRADPDGTKTVYYGITDLRWNPGTTTAQVARYYTGGTQRGLDGTLRYAIGGHQGSLIAEINVSTGTVTTNRYLPYGDIRYGNLPNDKGFLDQPHDATGLVYLNNRYHDPTLGTFISVDPLIQQTGEPYIYASGNPTTLSDPLGLAACEDDGNCPWSRGQRCSHDCSGPPVANNILPDMDSQNAWEIWRTQDSVCTHCEGFNIQAGTGLACYGMSGCTAAAEFMAYAFADGVITDVEFAAAKALAAEYCVVAACGKGNDLTLYNTSQTNAAMAGVLFAAPSADDVMAGFLAAYGRDAPSKTFTIASRVIGQLDDARLGPLQGQLGWDDLQELTTMPGAQVMFDTATSNINVIQRVGDVLLRITTASDEFKIISVGPIQANGVSNGIANGRFVLIGGTG